MTAIHSIDLNADLGEYSDAEGLRREAEILQLVTSCSIACGGHAGNAATIRQTLFAAAGAGVAVGAHPSYPDRGGFGRRSIAMATNELRAALESQLTAVTQIASELHIPVWHVKPHGALYNDAAENLELARLLADCIATFDNALALIGPPASALATAARNAGIRFFAEGFVDRAYRADGRLVSRDVEGAVLADQQARLTQALSIAARRQVTAVNGERIDLDVDTLCLHGDSEGAVETARGVRRGLLDAGFQLLPMHEAA